MVDWIASDPDRTAFVDELRAHIRTHADNEKVAELGCACEVGHRECEALGALQADAANNILEAADSATKADASIRAHAHVAIFLEALFTCVFGSTAAIVGDWSCHFGLRKKLAQWAPQVRLGSRDLRIDFVGEVADLLVSMAVPTAKLMKEGKDLFATEDAGVVAHISTVAKLTSVVQASDGMPWQSLAAQVLEKGAGGIGRSEGGAVQGTAEEYRGVGGRLPQDMVPRRRVRARAGHRH